MKLKEITLILENCDAITIDGKYIGRFLVDDLHSYIGRTALNSFDKVDVADTIIIEIHKDANKERYQFDQTQYEDFKQMTFDRLLNYKDITGIEFTLVENYVQEGRKPVVEDYNYYVDWVGDSDYVNEAQVNYLSKDGNLYIVIAKDKKIEDFFELEEIDSSEAMNFYFSMNDVGDKYGDPNRYKKNDESDREPDVSSDDEKE